MHCSTVVMKHSASLFALGQRAVILRCWKPRCSAKFLNSQSLKRGPLSLFKTSGIPYIAKIALSFGMVDLAEVDMTISTSGNRLYSSRTTTRSSPEGSGPRKSIPSSFHRVLGGVVIFRGSSRSALPVVAVWHGKQLSTFSLTMLPKPENQTFSLMRRFVYTIPWCSTCARSTALSLIAFGTTIQFPLSKIPW